MNRVCNRCNRQKEPTMMIFTARPHGHLLSSLPPFDLTREPSAETVCFDCLTDAEIARELRSVVVFVLTEMRDSTRADYVNVDNPRVERAELYRSLEHVLAVFTVRLNNTDYRGAALCALGGLIGE